MSVARRVDGVPRARRTVSVGVFDSGVGGLTVAAALRRALPDARIVYLADTANAPYGDKPPELIAASVLAALDRLIQARVDALVVACNTAAAAGLAAARERYPVPVVDVVAPTARAALARIAGTGAADRPIGVLGTTVTIGAGVYPRALPGRAVVGSACPDLVRLVERGVTTGAEVDAAVARRLAPVLAAGAGALILGCTHFPFLAAAIRAAVPAGVPLICGRRQVAAATATAVGRAAADRSRPDPGEFLAGVELRCTGDPRRFAGAVGRLLRGGGLGVTARANAGSRSLSVAAAERSGGTLPTL